MAAPQRSLGMFSQAETSLDRMELSRSKRCERARLCGDPRRGGSENRESCRVQRLLQPQTRVIVCSQDLFDSADFAHRGSSLEKDFLFRAV